MVALIQSITKRLITKTNLVFFIGVQNVLSIFTIFSSPLPIPPKTSIGILTGTTLLLLMFLAVLVKTKQIQLKRKISIIDWLVIGFVVANAISLLLSDQIFEITNFRLLLCAAVQYAVVRLVFFSNKERQMSIHIIGATTVIIAIISLFQILFRDQAIFVINRYIFGDSAYSFAQDLMRGRCPPWGYIVISFPLFISSALVLNTTHSRKYKLYVLLGIIFIPFAFIISNFRGLTLCFFIGLFISLLLLNKYKILFLRNIKTPLILSTVAAVIGIILASFVFQYNLIDRFLLKDKSRDITFSIGRLQLYGEALSAFAAFPISGIGIGNYRYVIERPLRVRYYNIVDGETGVKEIEREPVSSHNDVFTLLAEVGILGTSTFVLINYFVIRQLLKSLQLRVIANNSINVSILVSLLVALIMYYLVGLFENTAPNTIIFIFFLYAASITWFSKR